VAFEIGPAALPFAPEIVGGAGCASVTAGVSVIGPIWLVLLVEVAG
jgi:hypothetical protein